VQKAKPKQPEEPVRPIWRDRPARPLSKKWARWTAWCFIRIMDRMTRKEALEVLAMTRKMLPAAGGSSTIGQQTTSGGTPDALTTKKAPGLRVGGFRREPSCIGISRRTADSQNGTIAVSDQGAAMKRSAPPPARALFRWRSGCCCRQTTEATSSDRGRSPGQPRRRSPEAA
jgi:hypothetical protein